MDQPQTFYRVLIPNWRFFDHVNESTIAWMEIRGHWEEIWPRPRRHILSFFFNPEINRYHAWNNLLDRLAEEATAAPDNVAGLTSYQIVADVAPEEGGKKAPSWLKDFASVWTSAARRPCYQRNWSVDMYWVERLTAFAVLLQTVETLWIEPWTFSIFRRDLAGLPRLVRSPLLLLLAPHGFRGVLLLRLAAATYAVATPSAWAFAIMLASQWLVAVRWRGTLNGGSDLMGFVLLSASLISLCFPSLTHACLLYVAIQLTLSYFVAGLAKARTAAWRDGSALSR
ncbi:MAG: hypothetical protein HC902_10355, partial [Calothrix sp. SM1_5_4]|nr:hypothetical protein [Calothrix sp. SM1_5_4]